MKGSSIGGFAIGPIGTALLGLAALPVIAWFYSPEDIGRAALLQVAIGFAVLFFSLGLDQAYVREYHVSEDKAGLLATAFIPGLFLLLVSSVLILGWSNEVSLLLYKQEDARLILLTLACMLLAFISRFLSLVLRMEERGLAFSFSQLLQRLLYLLMVLVFIWASENRDFLALLVAHVVSMVAVVMMLAWSTRSVWAQGMGGRVRFINLRGMLSFGLPLIPAGIAFWGMTSLDRLFLRGYSDLSELGVYSVAVSFAAVGGIFQSVFSVVWAPTVYKWAAEGENLERIDKVTEYVLFAVVILFSLAGMFSWVINYFLPGGYDAIQYILMGCLAYPLFYTLSETTVVGLGVARKSGYAMMAAMAALGTSLLANYLLVPLYGARGASVATALAFWVFLVARTELSCRVWRLFPRRRLYIWTSLVLIISSFFVIFGDQYPGCFIATWFCVLLSAAYDFRAVLRDAGHAAHAGYQRFLS